MNLIEFIGLVRNRIWKFLLFGRYKKTVNSNHFRLVKRTKDDEWEYVAKKSFDISFPIGLPRLKRRSIFS